MTVGDNIIDDVIIQSMEGQTVYKLQVKSLLIFDKYYIYNKEKYYYPRFATKTDIPNEFTLKDGKLFYRGCLIKSSVDGFNDKFYYRFQFTPHSIFLHEYPLIQYDREVNYDVNPNVEWLYRCKDYTKYKIHDSLRIVHGNTIKTIRNSTVDKILDEDSGIGLSFHKGKYLYAIYNTVKYTYDTNTIREHYKEFDILESAQIINPFYVKINDKNPFNIKALYKMKNNYYDANSISYPKCIIVGAQSGLYILYKDVIVHRRVENLLKVDGYKYFTPEGMYDLRELTVGFNENILNMEMNRFIERNILFLYEKGIFTPSDSLLKYEEALVRVYKINIKGLNELLLPLIKRVNTVQSKVNLLPYCIFPIDELIEQLIGEEREDLLLHVVQYYRRISKSEEIRPILKRFNCFYLLNTDKHRRVREVEELLYSN